MEPLPPPIPAPTGSPLSLGADKMARAASDEWKSARTQLTDAIGSYLTACSSLRATCATALYQSPRNATVEEILANVAYELGYLASEEIKLRGVCVSLTEMRNMSMALAPINMLPDEILAHVLDLSTPRCARDEKRIVFHDLAAVCKRWRRVAMNATNLWAHIDVGPDTPVGLSTLLLERTRDSPICIHVYEPEYHDPRELEYDEPCKSTPADQINKVLEVLKPHMHRVYTLDINSPHSDTDLTAFVLNLWLCRSSPGLTRSLLIYCPEASYPVLDSEDNTTVMHLAVPDNADDTLSSLSTIHLSGVAFGWNSSVYHGLVDLRIGGNSAVSWDNTISTSQFAEILSASPALAVLKLKNLTISQPEGWTQPAPIPMNHLSVLNLGTMDPDNGLDMLFPLIGLPRSLPDISVSVVLCHKEQNGLYAFLTRSKITILCCKYSYPPEPFQLPPRHLIENLRTLILPRMKITKTSANKENLSFLQPPPILNHPLSVILLDCTVSFEGLKEFVSNNHIQQLRLDRCMTLVKGLHHFWHSSEDLREIQDQLMKTYQHLQCNVSKTDSTSQWPCRTMSDTARFYDGFP
ncbi:hypothetical protein FRC12_002974 [Ceratobasidium sp. 428]|nr:hypothetical protein FRC12_002974 [Ceratobasidium sp. 428]